MLAVLLLAGCAAPRGPGHAQAAPASAVAPPVAAAPLPAAAAKGAGQPVDRLPGWRDDTAAGLHEALLRQCALARPPEPWPALCAELPSPDALKGWIATRFTAWPLAREDGGPGLLTGYYEPVLTGSRMREHAGQAPLYRSPTDLVRGPDGTRLKARANVDDSRARGQSAGALPPYPTRAEIEEGRLLAGQELVWLDDPIEAFFLHVQGSGRVRLRDGSEMRVGFADHNGQPYHPIGRELVARSALAAEAVDADAIRSWLRANPAEADAVMRSNRRYVFFREIPDTGGGPPGSLGVPLTPMRSVATDPRHVPPGALLFVDSTHPGDGSALRRLVVSQDRGAAIVGPVRADLFWGSGNGAGQLAGRTKQPARIWLLRPR
ncbi:MAG: transglycosylase [Burkholderiales bacterium]|nr:MAG: transglycosylase [Burkholderiales bacterium]